MPLVLPFTPTHLWTVPFLFLSPVDKPKDVTQATAPVPSLVLVVSTSALVPLLYCTNSFLNNNKHVCFVMATNIVLGEHSVYSFVCVCVR